MTVMVSYLRYLKTVRYAYAACSFTFVFGIITAAANSKWPAVQGTGAFNAVVGALTFANLWWQVRTLTKRIANEESLGPNPPKFKSFLIAILVNIVLWFVALVAVGATYGAAKNDSGSSRRRRGLERRKGGRGGGGGRGGSGGSGDLLDLAIGLIVADIVAMIILLVAGFFLHQTSRKVTSAHPAGQQNGVTGEAKNLDPNAAAAQQQQPQQMPPQYYQSQTAGSPATPIPGQQYYPPQNSASPPPQQMGQQQFYPPQNAASPPPQQMGQQQFYPPQNAASPPPQQYYPPQNAASPPPMQSGQQQYYPPPQQH